MDNYDEINEEDQENQELDSEEEILQELYSNLRTKIGNLDLDLLVSSKKVKPEKMNRPKSKKIMSLSDFSKLETKPTKFISKRVEEKRKTLAIVEYRTFNARKPPYNFVRKQRNNMSSTYLDLSKENFPKL